MVILLVDDDESVRFYTRRLLKAAGFTVLTASDGSAALAVSRDYPGAIDLVLTDINMPQMDGLDLCRQIAVERPGINALTMSGNHSNRNQASRNGLPFLPKPFTLTALRHSVEALLGPIQSL